jgi:hypothetical protein
LFHVLDFLLSIFADIVENVMFFFFFFFRTTTTVTMVQGREGEQVEEGRGEEQEEVQ